MPAGNFCTNSEAPSLGFPHTANICSPGCPVGSMDFHGMASLVVKVLWVAPACAPAAGVAPVPRSCATVWVEIVLASAATTLVTIILFSMDSLLNRSDSRKGNRSTRHRAPARCRGDRLSIKALGLVLPRSEKCGDCALTHTVPAGGQHPATAQCMPTKALRGARVARRGGGWMRGRVCREGFPAGAL